ncbi:MAG TPA: ribonuclease III [Candidatus Saccharimonadales bacterium]|nr:ribonuclease III [Candidatus Saccharimonadales bacterium]
MYNRQAYLKFAQNVLGTTFKNIDLLATAFTHRSYLNEHRKSVKSHNERLEFLGDAVLELIVTEYLYNNFDEQEGVLTNWRSALVRTESISAAASNFGFEPLLRLSKGEKQGTARARSQILANCYEAVLGAIYLDQGYEATKKFVEKSLIITFDEILASGSWMDPKSHLQELVQSVDGMTPIYRVLSEEGPDHEKAFTIGAFVGGKLKGQGSGPSKQAGQIEAAQAALDTYEKELEIKNSSIGTKASS